MSKIRVGLIYGGKSGEHEVSVLSANSVLAAIDRQKYELYPIAITRDGRWLPGQSPRPLVESQELQVRLLEDRDAGETAAVIPLENQRGQLLSTLGEHVDVIFPVMHGPFGEDGTIQGLLEIAGIPYVGGGVLASAVGMDKAIMKAVFLQAGLPVGPYLVYLRKEWESNPERVMAEIGSKLGFPCFVKPANLGSSVGISKAHDPGELRAALDLAAEYDRKIVVEAMIRGCEIECSVLGNDEPIASLPGEIIPCTEFYGYEAKYILNDSKLVIPAELPPELIQKVQDLAVRSFKAIDCAGLARVDFFVEAAAGRIVVNEINTLPGFTKISMYPKLWEASGIGYSELIDRLLQLALERYEDKQRNKV
ncbi:D-alanine--D-alanine ligase [Hydrogenispora ethanolica]|uniref:D-alanine--D-alanine ligase n=1 Tax=Hydrogenispora ethanolica TaxID=1082276 RepID=UPI001A9CF095|nr:D-alanine--D-alanine ligase [Hydrogenispora ethanolica]